MYEEELEYINQREEDEYPEPEIPMPHLCDTCGLEMTRDEFEEFENQCYECIHEETGGVVDDDVYRELDFD